MRRWPEVVNHLVASATLRQHQRFMHFVLQISSDILLRTLSEYSNSVNFLMLHIFLEDLTV